MTRNSLALLQRLEGQMRQLRTHVVEAVLGGPWEPVRDAVDLMRRDLDALGGIARSRSYRKHAVEDA